MRLLFCGGGLLQVGDQVAARCRLGDANAHSLARRKFLWDEASLDRWLADPEKFAPGQRMGISVPEAAARRDLIAYLKQAAAAKK